MTPDMKGHELKALRESLALSQQQLSQLYYKRLLELGFGQPDALSSHGLKEPYSRGFLSKCETGKEPIPAALAQLVLDTAGPDVAEAVGERLVREGQPSPAWGRSEDWAPLISASRKKPKAPASRSLGELMLAAMGDPGAPMSPEELKARRNALGFRSVKAFSEALAFSSLGVMGYGLSAPTLGGYERGTSPIPQQLASFVRMMEPLPAFRSSYRQFLLVRAALIHPPVVPSPPAPPEVPSLPAIPTPAPTQPASDPTLPLAARDTPSAPPDAPEPSAIPPPVAPSTPTATANPPLPPPANPSGTTATPAEAARPRRARRPPSAGGAVVLCASLCAFMVCVTHRDSACPSSDFKAPDSVRVEMPDAGTMFGAGPIPSQPLPGQRTPPCKSGQLEAGAACWWFSSSTVKPPCPGEELFELGDKCVTPAYRRDGTRRPSTVDP